MSYYRGMSRGMGQGMGLILRRPTRTTGFRGMRGLRGRRMGRLGDDTTDYSTLPLTPPNPSIDTPLMPLAPNITDAELVYLNQMKQQAVIDRNPADYVSPEAAKAAGLDVNAVNAVWAQGLARFPTQQAALYAGIAPTVITQYWQASRAYVRAPSATPSWLTTNNLLLGGGILFGLSLLMGGGRRRR